MRSPTRPTRSVTRPAFRPIDRRSRRTLRRIAVVATLAASLTACGGAGTPNVAGGDASGTTPSLQGLQAVEASVADVGGSSDRPTDEAFAVSATDPRPVLVWAWSPTCSTCNATASDVEQFAAEHADVVRVVGLGTQSDEADARGFVARHAMRTPQMLWDGSSATWRYLGIAGQPAGRLFAPDGRLAGEWYGPIPTDEVLADVRALAAASATTTSSSPPSSTPAVGG